jgi:hypothetical protein
MAARKTGSRRSQKRPARRQNGQGDHGGGEDVGARPLSYCRDRMKYGNASPRRPSSFIKELAPEWLERVDLKALWSTPVPATTAKSRFAQMRAALGSV